MNSSHSETEKRALLLEAINRRLSKPNCSNNQALQQQSMINYKFVPFERLPEQTPLTTDDHVIMNIIEYMESASDIYSFSRSCLFFFQIVSNKSSVWDRKSWVIYPSTESNILSNSLYFCDKLTKCGYNITSICIKNWNKSTVSLHDQTLAVLLSMPLLVHLKFIDCDPLPIEFLAKVVHRCKVRSLHINRCCVTGCDYKVKYNDCALKYLEKNNEYINNLKIINTRFDGSTTRMLHILGFPEKCCFKNNSADKSGAKGWSKALRELVAHDGLEQLRSIANSSDYAVFGDCSMHRFSTSVHSIACVGEKSMFTLLGGQSLERLTLFFDYTKEIYADPLDLTYLQSLVQNQHNVHLGPNVSRLTARIVVQHDDDNRLKGEHFDLLFTLFPNLKMLTLIDTLLYQVNYDQSKTSLSNVYDLRTELPQVLETSDLKNLNLIYTPLTANKTLQPRTYCSVNVLKKHFPNVDVQSVMENAVTLPLDKKFSGYSKMALKYCYNIVEESTEDIEIAAAAGMPIGANGRTVRSSKHLKLKKKKDSEREESVKLRQALKLLYENHHTSLDFVHKQALALATFTNQKIIVGHTKKWLESVKETVEVSLQKQHTFVQNICQTRNIMVERVRKMATDYLDLVGHGEDSLKLVARTERMLQQYEQNGSNLQSGDWHDGHNISEEIETCCQKMILELVKYPGGWNPTTGFQYEIEQKWPDREWEMHIDDDIDMYESEIEDDDVLEMQVVC